MFHRIACAIACVLFLCGSGRASAQTPNTIDGVVVARGTGFPLQGAIVRVVGYESVGALTNAKGEFHITNVPAAAQKLVVESYGWERIEVAIASSARIRMSESPVNVAGVTVTASGAPQRQMTSSVSVGAVTGRELRELKPSHPAQIAGRIPGVYVSVAGSGEGHMTAIRQPLTTNPVYLYLEDGVPTRSTGFFNHNAMYEVNVPQAGRIEILKGPGTALYGSDAIGGVVNVETLAPSEQRELTGYAEGGSYGWNRALFSASGSQGSNGIRADLNLTKWGGWRDNADYDRESATLRWDHKRLKTVIAFSRIDQLDASALARSEFEATPTLNYYLFTTRKIRAFRAQSQLQLQKGSTTLSITPFVRDNRMDLVPFFQLSFDPTMYTTAHKSAGLLLRARQEIAQLKTQVTAGVDVDYSPGSRVENQIAMMQTGKTFQSFTKGALVYDYDVTFRGVSPYAQADINPVERLHLNVGARYDRLSFDYDNHLDDVQTGRYRRPADTKVSYDELSPKLGGAYEVATWLGVFASYRQSFRSPSESQIFRQGSSVSTTSLKPIIARSKEAGARGIIANRFDYEIAAYDMRVKDDVLTFVRADGVREVQNAGETRHRGIEIGAGADITSWLRVDAAESWSKQTYEEWSPRPTLSYAGHEIERAPHTITNLRFRVKPPMLNGAALTTELARISRYWEDPENTHMYEGHSIVNLNASVPLKWGVTVIGRVINLTDHRYAENAAYTVTDGEQLQPGAPRLIYIGIQGAWSR